MARDNERYWIERHRELQGNIRAVGNRSATVAQNERSYEVKIERLRRVVGPAPEGGTALELGCGVGMFAPALVELGYRYTGVDISPVALESARAREPRAEYVEGSLLEVDLGRRFDVVLCIDVLLHVVGSETWRGALKNIAGHLEATGVGVIKEHLADTRPENQPDHVLTRSEAQYRDALAPLGMSFTRSGEQGCGDFYLVRPSD